MATILVIHGPNLNLLGSREPELYGRETLSDIDASLVQSAESAGHNLSTFQSNAEHELIGAIHGARGKVDFIIINPGAFGHTSIALRDALLGVEIPFVEVHLSNVYRREDFRQYSYLSDVAVGMITGLGAKGYRLALDAIVERLKN